MELIRVLLVDDQCGVRRGLKMRLALETGIEVIGEASSGEDAFVSALDLPVDVIVMDFEMPGMTGVETAAALRSAGSTAAVILLSIHDGAGIRREAASAGIAAFVAKHQPSESLIAAIRDAAASRQAVLS
jgi:two-component system response regulator DesR